MRIEVLVGVDNPVFYSITKPKTSIGSDLACDIVVAEDQVSRKHLIVIQEGDQYSVVDQGSTNGSYLNEERLIPGRRVEFTSYFPVRLGSSVLISLVSDEEEAENKISIPFPGEDSSAPKSNPLPAAESSTEPDRTRVISLKELQSSSTSSLVKQRQAYKKKVAEREKLAASSKKTTKKKKKGSGFKIAPYQVVVALILGAAVYFTDTGNEPQETGADNVVATQAGKAATPVEPVKPELPKTPDFLAMVEAMNSAEKCSQPNEVLLCKTVKGADEEPWGVATVDGTLVVMINGSPYLEEVRKMLPLPGTRKAKAQGDPPVVESDLTAEEKEVYRQELWELAVGRFLMYGFQDNEYLKLPDDKIVFAFFLKKAGIPSLEVSFAVKPQALDTVRKLVDENRFSYVRTSRAEIMSFAKAYYDLNF